MLGAFARLLILRILPRRLVPVLTLGLVLAAAPRATAQRPANPDSAQQAQMTSMMGPMMGQMMEAMMEGAALWT